VADEFASLLAGHSDSVRAIAARLRAHLRGLAADVQENVKPGWKVVWYGFGPKMADQFAVVMPTRHHVGLGFAHGNELPDPARRLEGTGKRMRHVKVRTPAEADAPEVLALVRAEFARARAGGGGAMAKRPAKAKARPLSAAGRSKKQTSKRR
jgi:hypothetical protein